MHNIFGEKFLSHREPAWHRIGHVLDEPVMASEALERIGTYDVALTPLMTENGFKTKYNAIVREPTKEDPTQRVFGVVKGKYHLVTPKNFCSLWDLSVKRTIETLGALGKGEKFFVSTLLPKFDVRGDEMDNYLLAYSPMTGLDSIEVRVTPVRTVCQNTLNIARSMSSEVYKIKHTGEVMNELGVWLSTVYQKSADKAAVLKESFQILASREVKKVEVDSILEKTYPVRDEPKLEDSITSSIFERRHAAWEEETKGMKIRREESQRLLDGEGTALDTPATKGTAWGVLQAVVELEDYRKGKYIAGSQSSLTGTRALSKERAFSACMELVG